MHRDLKPANIMLTKSGAKLLDFGLARIDKRMPVDGNTVSMGLTNPGTILGTFQYMAPEQLEAKDADARTDLFAFGAVLFEMLTGAQGVRGQEPGKPDLGHHVRGPAGYGDAAADDAAAR